MSSQKQIDSARANGAKSHGPKTQQGRQKSSLNALKHGLYSSSVVLSTEPRKQYNEMLDAYLLEFQPQGPVELDLVEEMVAAKWRQRRLRAIEAELFEEEMCDIEQRFRQDGEDYNKLSVLTRAYQRQAESTLALLTRHEARLERAYSRALKNLLELQRPRKPGSTGQPQKMQERTQFEFSPPPATTARGRLDSNAIADAPKSEREAAAQAAAEAPTGAPAVSKPAKNGAVTLTG